MATLAVLVGGAVINAVALTSSNYIERMLTGDDGAKAEKERHDKALEAYETAQARYAHDRTKLLDWIEVNRENKELAKHNFTNTDDAFKLYNQAHPSMKLTMPKEPKFSDFYQPSEAQKQSELIFVGGSMLALSYVAFRFL